MSDTGAALIRAIFDDPDNDDLRLVYADYLDDLGDPRAEFIRVQLEMARPGCGGEAWDRLRQRQEELLQPNFGEWVQHLWPFDGAKVEVEFRRGFPDSITIRGGKARDLEVLGRALGLRKLVLEGCRLTPSVLRLVGSLPHLDDLTIADSRVSAPGLAALEPLPPWAVIRIRDRGFSESAWRAFQDRRIGRVARMKPPQRRTAAVRFLNALDDAHRNPPDQPVRRALLSQCGITDAELRFLSWLPELEEVSISDGWDVTTAGLRHLAALRNLKRLLLYGTRIDTLTPITGCRSLETLEFFPDAGGDVDDEATEGLERLTNLRQLVLHECDFADQTVTRIGSLRQLRELTLDVGQLESEDCLAALSYLTELESLTLHGETTFSDESLRNLSPLRRLHTLSMRLSAGDGDGLRHLGGLTELRCLYLSGYAVTDVGIRHLVTLTKLRTFMAQDSAITVAAARALVSQLPEATIILMDAVVKSPRRSLRLRRRSLQGFASALFPVHWSDDSRNTNPPTSIWVQEDGWENVGGWSGQVVGPASMIMWTEEVSDADARTLLRECVQNNFHLNPRVLRKNVVRLAAPRDTASCIYRNDHGQHLSCTAVLDGRAVTLDCETPTSRFVEFLPLFLRVARSMRVGPAAAEDVGSEIEISADELK